MKPKYPNVQVAIRGHGGRTIVLVQAVTIALEGAGVPESEVQQMQAEAMCQITLKAAVVVLRQWVVLHLGFRAWLASLF